MIQWYWRTEKGVGNEGKMIAKESGRLQTHATPHVTC